MHVLSAHARTTGLVHVGKSCPQHMSKLHNSADARRARYVLLVLPMELCTAVLFFSSSSSWLITLIKVTIICRYIFLSF